MSARLCSTTALTWTRALSEITLADLDLVGGKAAHLGAMHRAGFAVPEGFVITTDAFVEHFGSATQPMVRPSMPPLKAELMAEVVERLKHTLGEEAVLAVRSSAIGEDSAFASFAGQHSTYYFVPPGRLDQAILDCWMSLWSTAALAYRRAVWDEMGGAAPRMAVIVQKMLPAQRSGIAFSSDPIEHQDQVLVEATWGLGAALADGRVTPDRARVDSDGAMMSYELGNKALILPADNPSETARLRESTREQRRTAVLSRAEVEHIANVAAQLETLFESPQDVEWSFVGDQLYILQSRSITAPARDYPGSESLVLFKPIAENFSDPLTPLSTDLFAAAMPRIGPFIDGRLYIDLKSIRPLLPFEVHDADAARLLLLRETELPSVSLPGALRAGVIQIFASLAMGADWLRAGRMPGADLSGYRDALERVLKTETDTADTLFKRMIWGRHSFLPMHQQVFSLNIFSGRYFIAIGVLNRLVRTFAPEYPIEKLPGTYHGRRQTWSLKLLSELHHLGVLLDESPELRQQLEDQSTDASRDAVLASLPTGHPFTLAFDRFLREFGHRGPKEIELAAPRWREQPGLLLRLLAANPPAAKDPTMTHGEFLAARDELNVALKPWQRRVCGALMEYIAKFIQLREDTRQHHILGFDAMRSVIKGWELDLIQAGILRVPGDIFFLRSQELTQIRSGELSAEEAQVRVRKNRRRWQRLRRRTAVETFNVTVAEPATDGITGTCASAGRIEGIARVIHRPEDGYRLSRGEILIAPHSDPAWTPIFCNAGGAVIGTGSFLSHAGTIARELNLPCVVDVPDCTERIRDGARIHLDATSGTVTLL